jgi:hypothetical protein
LKGLDCPSLRFKGRAITVLRGALVLLSEVLHEHSGGMATQGPRAKLATRWPFSGSGKGSLDSFKAQTLKPSTWNIQ